MALCTNFEYIGILVSNCYQYINPLFNLHYILFHMDKYTPQNTEKRKPPIYDNQAAIWTTCQWRTFFSWYASRYKQLYFLVFTIMGYHAFSIIYYLIFWKGVLLTQFPKLHQISRKDLLGQNFAVMQKKFPNDYDFHPLTFNLPQDGKKLAKKMLEEQSDNSFW